MRPIPFPSACLCAVLLVPTCAWAHEYWLSLDRWQAPAGQEVVLSALSGTGFRGERKPWSSERVVKFVARTGVLLDLRRGAESGEMTWARLAPVDDGGTMFGYQSTFVPIELPAGQFDAYLKDEGLDAPLATRRAAHAKGPGRERYRRCAKAWLTGDDATRATRPLGLPLEIVPLTAPGADPKLQVMVLVEGRPLANALVKAWRAPLDTHGMAPDPETRDSTAVTARVRTDAQGRATLPVKARGEWLLSTVHMVPCREPDQAEWESTWASLTFARIVQ
jgi:uncharacterized GH25 family protein